MKKEVFDSTGTTLLRTEHAAPECGVDFCDDCGDCLACNEEDPCAHGGRHRWVIYDDVRIQ